MKHTERKHSKFSASGAQRWFNCPGSVELSEGLPDKSSVWAEEGTLAHEVLERYLQSLIEQNEYDAIQFSDVAMLQHAVAAGNFIYGLHRKLSGSEVVIETRITLDFIHPEMFGTFDGAVVDHFGTLHVFDYKYGAGHSVSPRANLQMIFYGLGLAHQYRWNFKRVRLWIIQPRIRGYDGPVWWEISMGHLKKYVDVFGAAVNRVQKFPDRYVEGQHCHWCKAKSVCPVKREAKLEAARSVFAGR